MKLVLYSGGQTRKNHVLHRAVADLAGRGARKSFTYIPFCDDGSEAYYRRAIRRYQPFGFAQFGCLAVDRPFDAATARRAFDADVIYLAGGNTFYFLHHLRKSGLLPKLRRFVESGGVLAGLSAGGLLMTPSIALAGYPAWSADHNDVGTKNLRALGLVDFEFYPHYERGARLLSALRAYSRKSANPILTAEDGGGIVVEGGSTTLVGRVNLLTRGELYRLR